MAVSVFTVIIILSSTAFAEDTAKDAMIAYSGTDTFAKLSSEERMACMMWIAEGGQMSEVCRGAATRLIAEEPDAVTPQQRRELFAATMGKVSSSKKTQPVRQSQTIKSDNCCRNSWACRWNDNSQQSPQTQRPFIPSGTSAPSSPPSTAAPSPLSAACSCKTLSVS